MPTPSLTVQKEITLNLDKPNDLVHFKAKQYDALSRNIKINLLFNDAPWALPGSIRVSSSPVSSSYIYAMIRYKKPDGTCGMYDTDEEGNQAVTGTSGNSYITIRLAEQILVVEGKVATEINFYNADGQKLTAFSFIIDVEKSSISDEQYVSSDYYNLLRHDIAAIYQVNEAFASATQLALDQVSVTIDDTLSIHGAIADAKAAGDMIQVSEDEPEETSNILWIKDSEEEIEIPTWEDFTELNSMVIDGATMIFKGRAYPEDDIDTFTQTGFWWINDDSYPINWPFSVAGRIIVFGSSSSVHFTKVQIAINKHGRILVRANNSSGLSWTEWRPVLEDLDISKFVPIYDETATYQVGDYVLKRNSNNITYVLYRCSTNIEEPEIWNSSHWVQLSTSTIDNSLVFRGQIASDANLDAITNLGDYWFNSVALLENCPEIPETVSGRLIVFGSTSSSLLTKVQILVTNNADFWFRSGVSASNWSSWVHVPNYEYVDGLYSLLEEHPAISWEQGSFSTPTWTKGSSTIDAYWKYVRFSTYPKLHNIKKIEVKFTGNYRVYLACRGWSSAVQYTSPFVYELTESDNTELNLTVAHVPIDTAIRPEEVAQAISVVFYPDYAQSLHQHSAIFDEVNGLAVNATSLKIGLYGASIVRGVGVSDLNSHLDGDYVDMSSCSDITPRPSSFYKYTGEKSWANKFKATMESRYANVTVENWAVSGATSESYYEILRRSFLNNNTPLNVNVDVAIIMMGNNGRTKSMEDNINGFKGIIKLFQEHNVQTLFLTPTAAFNSNSSYILNTYQIMQCSKIAASETDCSSIDAFHWIDDYCDLSEISIDYDSSSDKNFLNSDRLHPSDLGHDVIFKAIKSLLKV